MRLRLATVDDVRQMSELRMSVKENALVSLRIADQEYVDAITRDGRGWVADIDGELVGFSVGLLGAKNLWALFVKPGFEGRGIGLALVRAAFDWFHDEGVDEVTFTTAPDTRADRFYAELGCRRGELVAHGDVAYTWSRAAWVRVRGS
ncbi:MAG: GNAT family N-acetyltransferase [Polyangiaceae bacterium]